MNKHEANKQLKQLMLQYEQGLIDYSTYRLRRNTIIDQYAGVEEFIPPKQSFKTVKKTGSHKSASGISAAVTLILVITAALITFLAMSESEEKKITETFVDSSAAPLDDK